MVLASPDRAGLSKRIYHAYWVEDRDLDDPRVLAELAGDSQLVERAQTDPTLKQALIDSTTAARRAGVCGAPSFVVGDELFWGQDRLALVARALAGQS
jgi:2-hydroxychromene-2-carboxylate isomerase